MANINLLILGGRLTRPPEVRVTNSGTAICAFTVANSRKWKTEQGEQREDTAFVDCEAWGKTGESIAKFFAKGDPILVRGRIKQDMWDDKQTGQKRSKLMLTLEGFDFCGPTQGAAGNDRSGGGDDDQTPQPPQQQRQAPPQRQQPPQQRQAPVEDMDSDVPF